MHIIIVRMYVHFTSSVPHEWLRIVQTSCTAIIAVGTLIVCILRMFVNPFRKCPRFSPHRYFSNILQYPDDHCTLLTPPPPVVLYKTKKENLPNDMSSWNQYFKHSLCAVRFFEFSWLPYIILHVPVTGTMIWIWFWFFFLSHTVTKSTYYTCAHYLLYCYLIMLR